MRESQRPTRVLPIVLPAGLRLELTTAGAGDRILAYAFDCFALLVFWLSIVAVVAIIQLWWPASGEGRGLGDSLSAFTTLTTFALRTFGMSWMELRGQGRSFGKRLRRLRVVDARGGPLSTEAVLVRNLTRDLELPIPFAILFFPELVWPNVSPYLSLAVAGWVLIVVFLPLLSRERTRVGDLLAGTRVIYEPAVALLPDLAVVRMPRPNQTELPPCPFSREQLDIYGIYELEVLEDILRRVHAPGGTEAAAAVTLKIQKRIGWDSTLAPGLDPKRFLADFYAAQRGRLEERLLLGQRRENKIGSPPGRRPGA